MSRSTRHLRAPQRQLAVTCEGPSRLAVGRRPSAPVAAVEPVRPVEPVTPFEPVTPWSRGLWGVFLPDRRASRAVSSSPPEGHADRRRAA